MKTMRKELDALWADAANWRLGCVYVCAEDPRFVVHKRQKWAGYTINFAHRGGFVALVLMILFMATPALAFCFLPIDSAAIALVVGQILLIWPLIAYCRWETNRYD